MMAWRNVRWDLHRLRVAGCLALFAAFSFCGCNRPDTAHLVTQAALLCSQQKWDDAVPLLKGRLLDQPRDVAAHFYLGRCYFLGRMVYPGAAEGEFRMALALFAENGKRSPIKEFSNAYFELRCYLELAKVYLRTLQGAMAMGASGSTMHGIMGKLRDTVARAKRLAPDSEDVKHLERILESITERPQIPPPTRKKEAGVTT